MKEAGKKALTLKTLNKSNVWDLQENDIFRLLEAGEKDADLSDNIKHYLDIIRSAFEIEEVKIDRPEVISKYEARGLKVGSVKLDEKNRLKFGIKKKTIMRVTDLTDKLRPLLPFRLTVKAEHAGRREQTGNTPEDTENPHDK